MLSEVGSKGIGAPPAHSERALMDAAPPPAAAETFVVGDIGGTNARLQCFTGEKLVFERTYSTSSCTVFADAFAQFLADAGNATPAAACLAVAGPVSANTCAMTNIAWVIDGDELAAQFGLGAVRVLNDFEALAWGVMELPDDQLLPINDAPRNPQGAVVVVGPGTGLGEASLVYSAAAGSYVCVPGEGGHADFAPRGDLQRELAAYVEREDGHCEVEALCCGAGLVRIYDFLRGRMRPSPERPALEPADVSMRGLSGQCPLCSDALDMFLQILGAEAHNCALNLLATGGVYIAGGIPPKLRSRIEQGGLKRAFLHSRSRFHPLLKTFPVHIVLDEGAGLRGALAVARGASSSAALGEP